jgi:hypothetical protein
MSCPSHSPWLDHSNYIWRRVQITKLLVLQFSAPSRHFIPSRSKHPTQHPVLKHPQSMSLSPFSDEVFHLPIGKIPRVLDNRGIFTPLRPQRELHASPHWTVETERLGCWGAQKQSKTAVSTGSQLPSFQPLLSRLIVWASIHAPLLPVAHSSCGALFDGWGSTAEDEWMKAVG